MVGGHNRLRIGWHAGFARSTIVDHVKLEHAGGERQILDGLHIAGTVRTHGRIGSEHQRAHAQLAHHLSKEESVRFRRERQRVTHDERVIHAQLVDGAQTLLHAGERLRVDHACRRLLATVLRRVAVHERWAWIEQHHHGEGLFLLASSTTRRITA